MAVTLRLARHGQKNRPQYRIVATDSQSRRDGRFLEIVGRYNALSNPQQVTLKEDRVKYWLGVGAKTSGILNDIIKKSMPGYLENIEKARLAKIQSNRKKRKARIAAAGKAKPSKEKKAKAPKVAKTKAPKKKK